MRIPHRPLQNPHFFILLLSLSALTLPATSQSSNSTLSDSSCFENSFYDCSICSCDTNEPVHNTFIVIIHLISCIISILFIILFFYVQGLHRHPGSIVVALTFTNLIYSAEITATSIKNMTNTADLISDGNLCTVLGYVNLVSLALTYLYQIAFFAFYTYVKHQQRSSRTFYPEYHVVPIALTAFLTIYLYTQDAFGMTISGGCSIKSSTNVAAPTIAFGVLIAISFALIYLMRRIYKSDNPVGRTIMRATSRYSKYLLIMCIFYVAICILRAVMAVKVGEYSPSTQGSVSGATTTIEIFLSILQILNTFIVMMAWLRDPKSYEPLQGRLGGHRWINWLWTTKSSHTFEDSIDDERERLDRHLLGDRSDPESGHVTIENNTSNPVTQPVQSVVSVHAKEYKMNVIFTILMSIRYYWHMQKHRKLEGADAEREKHVDPLRRYKHDAKNKASFHISTANMQKEMPKIVELAAPQHQNIVQGVLTVYAMNLFGEIIHADEMAKYIQGSLDVGKNFHKVAKTGFNPKGTSTAFNFMSADDKLIFKSITEDELHSLLKMLPHFMMHLKSNQNSLIAKIYGAFTYEVMTPHQKFHFIAISNVNRHFAHSIERTYELKGTTRFRRTVMEDKMRKPDLRHCGVLKDHDFNNFEGMIKVDRGFSKKLLNTLKRDIQFLMSQHLVDYSLSLFIVSRERLPSLLSDVDEEEEQYEESFPGVEKLLRGESIILDNENADEDDKARRHNPLSQVESSDEEFDYVMGIVDYLKEYNLKKRINIKLRNWGMKHSHDDLTSEDPNTYGRRLLDYLDRILEN